MERRRFTAEFKREAVNLAGQEGVLRAKVAQELGLNVNMLARWVRQASRFSGYTRGLRGVAR